MSNFKLGNVITAFLVTSSIALTLVHSSSQDVLEGRLVDSNISLEHFQKIFKQNLNGTTSFQTRAAPKMLASFKDSRHPQEDGPENVSYKLGQRQLGDRLVYQTAEVLNYPKKEDVSIRLIYPEEGTVGNIVTYVEITCEQDNDAGNAFISYGGIGQRSIEIILEAKQTAFFSYIAKIYAIN